MRQDVDDEGYYIAQVCTRGHLISAYDSPLVKHCSSCGATVITSCAKCDMHLRGAHASWDGFGSNIDIPSFCRNCGTPFPWMEERLSTARELLYHIEGLSIDEKNDLWNLLSYVLSTNSDLLKAKEVYFERS